MLKKGRVGDHHGRRPPGGLRRGSTLLEMGSKLRARVIANRLPADHATALPGVGPIDLSVHQLDCALDVASVERAIGGSKGLVDVRDTPKLAALIQLAIHDQWLIGGVNSRHWNANRER